MTWRPRVWLLAIAVLMAATEGGAQATAWQAIPVAQQPSATLTLPTSLSDEEFWQLSTSLSEAGGFFRSENLVSNEHTYQYVIPSLRTMVKSGGGAYLGVAPDQNFTFMAAIRPRIAFILDIRRGNLLQHLMYKALFELSADRAEFVSRLFSSRGPRGSGPRHRSSNCFPRTRAWVRARRSTART